MKTTPISASPIELPSWKPVFSTPEAGHEQVTATFQDQSRHWHPMMDA